MKGAVKAVVVLVLLCLVLYFLVYQLAWRWVICRTFCPRGQSLLVTRKVGEPGPLDAYASGGQKGVQDRLAGPGRHFFSPYTYAVEPVEDVVIEPGKIGLVKNNLGKDPLGARFIVGPDEKGTQRNVLTPGLWRINTYGQKVEIRDAIIIGPGYVGVQTRREGENKGILPNVLQPGYYNINPEERRIDVYEIGYRVWSVQTQFEAGGSAKRRVKKGTGVSFPLADGKQMYLDLTVVWGVFAKEAPRILKEYGTVQDAEYKIIEPQVRSICKNIGSNLTTLEFIEGESRERFQRQVTEALQEMGEKKGIHILIALVRGFHAAEDIKATIQAGMIAEEEKTTLLTEQKTDMVAAQLEQAEKIVDIAVRDFDAETEALVAAEREEGLKKAAEIKAKADREVASLDKQRAEVLAAALRIQGQAEADVIEAKKKADAKRLELHIAAFGGPNAFNLFTFAEHLPKELNIQYRYAGPGTLWTSPQSDLKDLSGKKLLEYLNKKEKEKK